MFCQLEKAKYVLEKPYPNLGKAYSHFFHFMQLVIFACLLTYIYTLFVFRLFVMYVHDA